MDRLTHIPTVSATKIYILWGTRSRHPYMLFTPDPTTPGGEQLRDFHYRIAQGAHNSMISTLLCGDLYQLLRLYRYQHKSTPGRARGALQEHRRIVDALRDRDGELAELLMRRHISTARRGLEASIAKAEAPCSVVIAK